jgi:hypothetical protein
MDAAPAVNGNGMVALMYNGERDATHSYTSPHTGAGYSVAKGEWIYVLPADVPWLTNLPGWSVYEPSAPEPLAPALV